MKVFAKFGILAITIASQHVAEGSPLGVPPPEWAKDLVIYEVATKSFTSPNGPGSGTFASLQQKLPHLEELGINAIWLTGHSLADPKHFYNIWTQYAVIEPDQFDPTLGTAEEFKAMIDDAHQRGIRLILEVVTHGVMPDSQLIKKHPHWFRGGSWGMVDFDWSGGHTDLDDWWVELWTGYVTRYGVDGFRLDTDIYRPDLWARIRQNAAAAGHPIVILNEELPTTPDLVDLVEKESLVAGFVTGAPNELIFNDLPRHYASKLLGPADYRVEVEYEDGTVANGATNEQGTLQVQLKGFTPNRIDYADRRAVGGYSEVSLQVSGIKVNVPKQIIVTRILEPCLETFSSKWRLHSSNTYEPTLTTTGVAPSLTLFLKTPSPSPSIQLSSHDNGWVGFPRDKAAYVAQGSRATMGYSTLFAPAVPLFMAGEEFDATFHPLPTLSPDLFGGKDAGSGRWLYGAQLDWSELKRPPHSAMFEDVKRMLAIRKQEKGILEVEIRGELPIRLAAVAYQSDIKVPVPYVRWNQEAAIIVLANRNTETDAHLTLNVPLERLGPRAERYLVTDLWSGGPPRSYSARQLSRLAVKVKRDKRPRGGLGLLKIEKASQR